MKNTKRRTLALSVLIALLCAGCKEANDHGNRTQLEVMLKGGGTAVLVCPKFDREPAGAHGRECYLKSDT